MTTLSAIITTCNRYEHLMRLIDSIAASTRMPDECIVIDDCSDDKTAELTDADIGAHLSGVHCTVIHNESRMHMVNARNAGAHASSGAYCLFIDDDNEIDADMCAVLLEYMEAHPECGIAGPAMYVLQSRRKYLNFQTINFFTGKTTGHCASDTLDAYPSHGVPNVFMIRKKTLEAAHYFDAALIQTFTEPDFAFSAMRYGYACVMLPEAITYHDIPEQRSIRSFGGTFRQKGYCTMRNRALTITRYGRWYHRVIYGVFFAWFWPFIYSLIALRHKRTDLPRFYWYGWRDGMLYLVTRRLRNSLPRLKP